MVVSAASRLLLLRSMSLIRASQDAVISYFLPEKSFVSIEILDLAGRKVETLLNKFQSGGIKKIKLEHSQLKQGTYILRLTTNFGSKMIKITKTN